MRMALTLVIGTLGGSIFYLLSMPLPWMLGSMTFCLVAVLARLPLTSARRYRPPLVAIIGVTLGSAFSAELMGRIGEWYPVIAAVLVSSILASALAVAYLVRVARFDPVTAYFAGMPGGLYEMVLQGGAAGGDEQRIALIQAARIFFVVMFIPLFFRLTYDVGSGDVAIASNAAYTFQDIVILVGCAVVGWPLARLLRLPNPPLVGPLVMSALVHMLEHSSSAPPYVLFSAAQVVLGSTVGAQFIGAPVGLLGRMLVHGAIMISMTLALCFGFALVIAMLVDVDIAILLLGLAPGGMTEMCLIALALKADVAFVSINQLCRIMFVHLAAPFAFRLLRPLMSKSPPMPRE